MQIFRGTFNEEFRTARDGFTLIVFNVGLFNFDMQLLFLFDVITAVLLMAVI